MTFEVTNIKISNIVSNKGQIEGLPANPRLIKDEKFKKLIQSIEDNPEMLKLRELLVVEDPNKPNKYIIIGGNMRFKAMKELNYKDAICKVIKDASIEQLKAYIIKDNNGFGEWDFDMLRNDWDEVKIADWGIDLPVFEDFEDEYTESEEIEYEELKEDVFEQRTSVGDVWMIGNHKLIVGKYIDGEEPLYLDMAIAKWENMTGLHAEKIK